MKCWPRKLSKNETKKRINGGKNKRINKGQNKRIDEGKIKVLMKEKTKGLAEKIITVKGDTLQYAKEILEKKTMGS